MDQNNRDVQESKCFSVQSDYGEVELKRRVYAPKHFS